MKQKIQANKRIVIFGGGGTVGKEMVHHLKNTAPEYELYVWDRHAIPLVTETGLNERGVLKKLAELSPDFVLNFAVCDSSHPQESKQINIHFPIWLAKLSQELSFRLLHTSSVMVFSDHATGPFTLKSLPDAADGYGMQKRLAEEGILQLEADCVIARLGWQISGNNDFDSNTMERFLDSEVKNKGSIRASSKWYPSCSRLQDTVRCIWHLCTEQNAGVYQLEGNPGLSFAEIALRLKQEYKAESWRIKETVDFVFNQRMIDTRVEMQPIFK